MSQITSKIIRTGSIFRPRKPIDQSVLEDNKKLIEKIDRRNVLRGALSLGALSFLRVATSPIEPPCRAC